MESPCDCQGAPRLSNHLSPPQGEKGVPTSFFLSEAPLASAGQPGPAPISPPLPPTLSAGECTQARMPTHAHARVCVCVCTSPHTPRTPRLSYLLQPARRQSVNLPGEPPSQLPAYLILPFPQWGPSPSLNQTSCCMPSSAGTKEGYMVSDSEALPSAREATGNTLETKGE